MSRLSKIVRRFHSGILSPQRKLRPADFLKPLERWIVLIIIFAVTVVLTAPPLYFTHLEYTLNQPVRQTIKAPFTLMVEDAEATELARKAAEETYIHYYEFNGAIQTQIVKKTEKIFKKLAEISSETRISDAERIKKAQEMLAKEFGVNPGEKHTVTLLQLANNPQTLINLNEVFEELFSKRGVITDKYAYQSYERKNLVKLLEKNTVSPLRVNSATMLGYPEEVRDYLRNNLLPRYFSQIPQLEAIYALITSIIQPNIYLLEEATQRARISALKNVKPVVRVFEKGDVIITAGKTVTADVKHILETINEKARYYNLLRLLGDIAFVLIIFLAIVFYIHKISRELTFTSSNIILLSLPVLISLAIGRALLVYVGEEAGSGYLYPAGIIGMLGVILLNPRITFALVVCGALLFGLAVDFNFRYTLIAIFGGLTALVSLYTVRERKDVLMAGFKTALVNFILILVISLVDDPTHIPIQYAALGILNGILCGFITLPSLPLFEYFFGVVTDVRLLELTGINKPILQELEEKAPGTYQHSLSVAKLAEPAAQAIGANYLLVRAGAYYHDIGKLAKPKYYAENQITPEDKRIHNNLSPNMSMLIVRTHIREGIELARKYGLPQKIIDFIPQHHGTSLIKYFYQRALQQYNESESNIPVREEDFRYLGPKPQTVEAAIVMLADAVEATVTSRLSHAHISEDEIRRVVHETIVDKFNDGQLDECPLTLRDLHNISESFVTTLMSRFHFRVQYPVSPLQKELGKAMAERPELSQLKI